MERRVSLLPFATLVLLTLSGAQGWSEPSFCHNRDCPEFKVVEESGTDFEVREYNASLWITTKVASIKNSDLLDGYYKLKDYCTRQADAGHKIPTSTWPVLITTTQKEDGSIANMSWFVHPDVSLPNDNDPTVTWEVRPAATVYVRIFDGIPSNDLGQANVKQLREALVAAGKSFEPHRYTAAGYENPMNIFVTHHSEIWIYGA